MTLTREQYSILEIVKKYPPYIKKGREESFLGIPRSVTKRWIGWKYIDLMKVNDCLRDEEYFDEVLKLALNYYIFNKKMLD